MKIAELFGKGKTVFSCEVFPPKKDSPVDTIYQTLDGLKEGEYRQASREEWAKLEKGIANSSQLPSSNHQKTGGHHGKQIMYSAKSG